ncbi:MAG: fatty acid desaturase, partial [Chromatiales bacterium]|nr:fatty acid desaturase [Chromatiales bacterium]
MFYGFVELPWWGYVVVTLIATHLTILGVTIYLHRAQAHRAVDLHPVVAHLFRFWLWLTTGMVTREWVAIHRKHHAKAETPEDPHSPHVFGIRKVLLQGAELYRAEARNRETVERYGHGTPDDRIERVLYGRFPNYGIVLLLLLDLLLFGVAGITIWAVQMLWIPFWAAGVINGAAHFWGYRNYEMTGESSTNICNVGLLIGGEELHNNHHAFPGSARFSRHWWEFDVGWMYIRLLAWLGLAQVRRVAPRPYVDPAKRGADMETVRAVVTARMQVMADYARCVMQPVLKEERARADASCRALLRRARRLLLREEGRMDERARERLSQALDRSQSLRTVYEFRARLQAVWGRAHASHEALLHALQDWCAQAEASGVRALRE